MHKITLELLKESPDLAKLFASIYDPFHKKAFQKKINFLENRYVNETAYLLSCGPSINEIWNKEIEEFLSDKLVIAVKQTQKLAPDIVDFHLYNNVRMETYAYSDKTVRISACDGSGELQTHVHFPIVHGGQLEGALTTTQRYEGSALAEKYERAWGPGIMFEVGLFWPIHLGCKKVVTLGFDLTAKSHFYDGSIQLKNCHKDEVALGLASMPYFVEWAKKKGVEFRKCSSLSAAPLKQVKRLEV